MKERLYLYAERAAWSAIFTFLGALGADALLDLNFGQAAAALAAGLGAALNVVRDFADQRLKRLREREKKLNEREKG